MVDWPAEVDLGVLGKTMLDAARVARIGVIVTLLDGGEARNIHVSEAAADILGWSQRELIESDIFMHVASADLPHVRERLAKRLAGEGGEATYELRIQRKDGQIAHVEVTASSTKLSGRLAVVSFLVDITSRRAAEEARRRTEASFHELIEKAPEPIGIFRGDHFVYANPAFIAVLGYPDAASLYAMPVSRLVLEEEVEHLTARVKQLMAQGRPPPYAYKARRHDGSLIVVETSSVPFDYEGRPSILTMARDVTERRMLQARLVQADRLAALGTMAAGVAHEINNPLAYVLLNLDWISRKLAGVAREPESIDALSEMLLEARRGAERVATIVHELRSFSRADGETRKAVDLATVVRSSIKIAGHEIRPRARVSISVEPMRPVWGNEARLEQVVLNLLLNAAQALPESRVESNEIRIAVRSAHAGHAVLEISDNGEGIAPEILPRIFDPFFTTKPPGVGTGLGLSICHGIVASLGGQITVHSDAGEGTTFRVVLPTTDETSAPESGPGSAPESSPPRSQARARVLVIDDEFQIANTLRELLSVEHDVVAETSGAAALALVEEGPGFDVMFCDLMMPGMNGMEFYQRVRRSKPELERRIVFMTGGAFTASAAEFLSSVENRWIEKPFSLGVVEAIVREMRASRVP